MSRISKSPASAQSDVFGDISLVAERERVRLFGPPQETVEVQMLRLQASDEAQQVIADALAHAEAIRRDAREIAARTGYADGYAEGLAAAAKDVEWERQAFSSDARRLTECIEAQAIQLWKDSEVQIISFVLEVAQKVIKDHTKVNQDAVMLVVRNALRRTVDSKRIIIRVNESDLEQVRSSRNDLLTLVDGIERLEIIEDRRVSQGGCVVESDSGTIDARVETQLAELRKAFTELAQVAA